MKYALTKYSVESSMVCDSLRELPPVSELVSVSRGFCYDKAGNYKAVRVTLYYRNDICVVNLYEPEDVRDFFHWLDEVFSINKGGN